MAVEPRLRFTINHRKVRLNFQSSNLPDIDQFKRIEHLLQRDTVLITQQNLRAQNMNRRERRLIGNQFELTEDVDLGTTRVQIGDTMWKVESESPIAKGTRVEVVDTNRMSLVIAAV